MNHYQLIIGIVLGVLIYDYVKLRINSWKRIKVNIDRKDKKEIKSMNRKSDKILNQFQKGLIWE